MFKGKAARPTGVNSISDSNEVEKLALTSHKSTWAPLVFFLGPCFSSKKVQFGRPVEHISYRDNSKLYESISTDTAVLAWSNAAHEGTLKGLRQTIVHGIKMRLCALYFSQKLTKKELLGEMRQLITYDFVFESFQMALRRMRNEKVAFKLTNTLQVFIPDVLADARAESITRLKWAVKYNPEVISFDEGNLLVDTYDIQEGFMFAHKYGRKIRIARWGGEIADVPLCELLYRSLLDFLQTGRYVDCEYVARARIFAENKSLNGLGELATPEDIAFDYGFVLDKDGFVTKLHKPLTPVLGKKFFVTDLFRTKTTASPTPARTEKDTKSPRRMSSFRSAFTSKTSAESAPDDINALERQIQRELGINESNPHPASGSVMSADIGAVTEKESEGEGSLALIVAEAARNAQKVRRETNWVAFLNHKVPSSVTATYVRSKKGTALSKESQTQPTPSNNTRVESTKETDLLAGLGSYTYGLGEKKPYKPAQSSAADAAAVIGPKDVWAETAEILAPPTVPKQEALLKRNTSEKEAVTPSHLKHVQSVPSSPAQTSTEKAVSERNEKVEKKVLTIVIPNSHSENSKSKARHTTVIVKESHELGILDGKQAQPRREEKIGGMGSPQTEKEETAVDGKLVVGSSAKLVTINAPPSFSGGGKAVKASALPIFVPVQRSAVPEVALLSALPAAPVVEPAADRTAPASKEVSVPPAPLDAPAGVPSPRFSPRARLVPTLSDIDMSNETSNATATPHGDTVSKNMMLEQKDTVLDTEDQAADHAVAAALAKAHSFKTHGATSERSVEPIASPRVLSPQPSAAVVHRPVLRAPSTMQMQAKVPTSKLAPTQLPQQAVIETEFVPVTVKEKKDVIETRIRSQRAPLDVVSTGSPRNAKHAQTQSLQHHNIPNMVNPIEVPMPPQFSAPGPTGRDPVAQSSATEANAKAPHAATVAPPLKRRQGTVESNEKQRESSGSGYQSTSKAMTQKSLQKKWAFSTVMQQQVR